MVQKLGLASSRLTSDSTRAIYADTAYGAFGEPYAQSDQVDLSFTGQNQDTVTNLYDFSAREYGTQGRWPSPDPAGTASAIPTDPQTWNRYAYVRNSPLSMLDPSGLDGMDYYDLESDNFDWEGNFGWGTSYTMNGLSIPASVAQGLLGNPDAASPCITCQSPGVGLDQYGIFQQTLRDYIQIQCTMFSDGDVCFLAPKGRNYLQVINPNDYYASSIEAVMDYELGLSGRWSSAGVNAAMAATSPEYFAAGFVTAGPAAAEAYSATAQTASELWLSANETLTIWQVNDLDGFIETQNMAEGFLSGAGPTGFTGPFTPAGYYGWSFGVLGWGLWHPDE